MNKILARQFSRAKSEGRVCARCGWMISVKDWKKGNRTCPGCRDALRGVRVIGGHWAPRDEPSEKTGEMI
jgi:hypothetical protein